MGISILMYHQVGVRPMRAHRANYCDAGCFARQMALLHRLGYRLDLNQTLACLRRQASHPGMPCPSRSTTPMTTFPSMPCRCCSTTASLRPSMPSAAGFRGGGLGSG